MRTALRMSTRSLWCSTLLAVADLAAAETTADPGDGELLAANQPPAGASTMSDADWRADTATSPAIATGTLSGSRYEINDARLRVGFLPDHATANGNGFNWDHNLSIGLLFVRSPRPLTTAGGFIWGWEGSFNNGLRSDQGEHTSYYGGMADVMAGWAYRMPNIPNLHFEGTPFVGIGIDHYNSDQNGQPTSFDYEYGLRAASYWTFATLWQAGLDLRLMENRAHPQFDGPVGGVAVTTSGLTVLFTGGRRF